MPLPVFDAMALEIRDQVVIAGGFTKAMEATKAIQIRHPSHGWLPIGSTLGEPRARASLTPLPSGRVLVLGGFAGTWGKNAVPLASGETIDLLVAGSSRSIEPWPESLDGHSATPLPDGRVAVACGCEVRVFDPEKEQWSSPIELHCERRHHASALVGMTLVLVGGDPAGTIESIDLRDPEPQSPLRSELWRMGLPGPLDHIACMAVDGRSAFAAGGLDPIEGVSVNSTWCLDIAKRMVVRGPSLELPQGACDLILASHPRGVLVLDGEWRSHGERGNANAAFLLSPIVGSDSRGASAVDGIDGIVVNRRVWALPTLAGQLNLSRRILLRKPDGSIEVLGGYRYQSPDGASTNEAVGVIVDGSAQRLVVDAQGTAD